MHMRPAQIIPPSCRPSQSRGMESGLASALLHPTHSTDSYAHLLIQTHLNSRQQAGQTHKYIMSYLVGTSTRKKNQAEMHRKRRGFEEWSRKALLKGGIWAETQGRWGCVGDSGRQERTLACGGCRAARSWSWGRQEKRVKGRRSASCLQPLSQESS